MLENNAAINVEISTPLENIAQHPIEIDVGDKMLIEKTFQEKREYVEHLNSLSTDDETPFSEKHPSEQEAIIRGDDINSEHRELIPAIKEIYSETSSQITGSTGELLDRITNINSINKSSLDTYTQILLDVDFIKALRDLCCVMKGTGVTVSAVNGLIKPESIIEIDDNPSVEELYARLQTNTLVMYNGFCSCHVLDCIPKIIELNTIVSGYLQTVTPEQVGCETFGNKYDQLRFIMSAESHYLVSEHLASIVRYTLGVNEQIFRALNMGIGVVESKLLEKSDLTEIKLTLNTIYAKHGKERADKLVYEEVGTLTPTITSIGTEGLTENGLYDSNINDYGNYKKAIKLNLLISQSSIEMGNLVKSLYDKCNYFQDIVCDRLRDNGASIGFLVIRSRDGDLTLGLLDVYRDRLCEDVPVILEGHDVVEIGYPDDFEMRISMDDFSIDDVINKLDNIVTVKAKHILKNTDAVSLDINWFVNNIDPTQINAPLMGAPSTFANTLATVFKMGGNDSPYNLAGKIMDVITTTQMDTDFYINVENELDKVIGHYNQFNESHHDLGRFSIMSDHSVCNIALLKDLYDSIPNDQVDYKRTILVKVYYILLMVNNVEMLMLCARSILGIGISKALYEGIPA